MLGTCCSTAPGQRLKATRKKPAGEGQSSYLSPFVLPDLSLHVENKLFSVPHENCTKSPTVGASLVRKKVILTPKRKLKLRMTTEKAKKHHSRFASHCGGGPSHCHSKGVLGFCTTRQPTVNVGTTCLMHDTKPSQLRYCRKPQFPLFCRSLR